jgi:hypothetical protein
LELVMVFVRSGLLSLCFPKQKQKLRRKKSQDCEFEWKTWILRASCSRKNGLVFSRPLKRENELRSCFWEVSNGYSDRELGGSVAVCFFFGQLFLRKWKKHLRIFVWF